MELLWRDREGARKYKGFSLKRKKKREENVVEHQKITANCKKQVTGIKDFKVFLCMGR